MTEQSELLHYKVCPLCNGELQITRDDLHTSRDWKHLIIEVECVDCHNEFEIEFGCNIKSYRDKGEVECLDCGYTGTPGYDDGGNIKYCPECESMNLIYLNQEEGGK